MLSTIAISILLAVGVVGFAFELHHRFHLVRIGRDEVRWDRPLRRLARVGTVVFGQTKLLRRSWRGVMHFVFFWGFIVLQTVTLGVVGEGIFGRSFRLPVIGGTAWLGALQEAFSAAVVLAILYALYNRYLSGNPHIKAKSQFDALFILVGIAGLMITFFLVNGWMINAGEDLPVHVMPISGWVAGLLAGMPLVTQATIGAASFWTHAVILVALLLWIPRGKHMHLVAAPLNVFFSGNATHRPGTALRPLHIDLETMGEGDVLGAGTVQDLTWKELFDSYACTECGRCQDQCPAYLTGKDLTPKGLEMRLRRHLEAVGPALLAGARGNGQDGQAGARAASSVGPADQEGGGASGSGAAIDLPGEALVPDLFSEDFVWSCTTCRACVWECPVDIEHIDPLIDMRRYKVMMESDFPPEAIQLFKSLEQKGNPWGIAESRLAWAEGLDLPLVGEDASTFDLVYWLGCTGAFDPAGQKVSRAMVQIMQAAGVNFAVLGDEETCNGDQARRLGNEYLFQMLAQQNIETFRAKNVRRIVTQCPHCYNVFKHEYPQFGGHFEVLHHTELIAELIRQGRLELEPQSAGRLTFHDSCYLGRHNDIYEAPRQALAVATGEPVLEMPRHRQRGFCCGAGGGRMWLEEKVGQRVNMNRIGEALALEPKEIAVACPFCYVMLDDALKSLSKEDEVRTLDVAQVVARALVRESAAAGEEEKEKEPLVKAAG